MNISLPPFAPENLVSRDKFSSPPSRVSLFISPHSRLNPVVTHGIPSDLRDGVHIFKTHHTPSGQF